MHDEPTTTASHNRARQIADRRRAMRLSLAVGALMLVGKTSAYVLTGSAAILSDAAESVVHVVAVGFAAFSLALSVRPADRRFRYGYERIAFFSAGFEGALIILAAVVIIVAAVESWLSGLHLQRLGLGTLVVAVAGAMNAVLGLYLVRTGRRTHSIILEANGRHVLTDSYTSLGVLGGLLLVLATGWKPFDPLVAIAVALNILWAGGHLVHRSIAGLMDYADPQLEAQIVGQVDALTRELGIAYHEVRFRHTGHRVLVELHLLFRFGTPVGEAHRLATIVEERLPALLPFDTAVFTHLEAVEDHTEVHRVGVH